MQYNEPIMEVIILEYGDVVTLSDGTGKDGDILNPWG